MASNIVQLHSNQADVAFYLHLGHTFHQVVDSLVSQGAFPVKRVVVDASHLKTQHGLIAALKSAGIQLVLDSKAAELATPGGVSGACRALPWAPVENQFWTPGELEVPQDLRSLCRKVARFSVDAGVDVVLAPTHLIQGPTDSWLPIDFRTTELLRAALDAEGGRSIRIDYPLIGRLTQIASKELVQTLIRELPKLPVQNLWIRASGLGSSPTCAAIRRYVELSLALGATGLPIVAERISGIPAMTLAAFGAVGAIAHGMANVNEQFNCYNLRKPRANRKGGRGAKWIYVPAVDQYLSDNSYLELGTVQGARSRIVCTDDCCGGGQKRTVDRYVGHSIVQRTKQLAALNTVPTQTRPHALLRDFVTPVGRRCRQIADLSGMDRHPDISAKLLKRSKLMDSLHETVTEMSTSVGRARIPQAPALHYSKIFPEVSGY